MSWRPLAETMLDLIGAAHASGESAPEMRITRLKIAVPIEVRLRHPRGEPLLLADVPLWRWVSGFEEQLGRLSFDAEEKGAT